MIILVFILLTMIGPPTFFFGLGKQTKDKQRAKWFYIIAVVYLIVGFGICGTMINGF